MRIALERLNMVFILVGATASRSAGDIRAWREVSEGITSLLFPDIEVFRLKGESGAAPATPRP